MKPVTFDNKLDADAEKLTAADRQLVGLEPGKFVPLTPDLIQSISEALDQRMKEIDETYPAIVADAPQDIRLAVAVRTVRALYFHAKEGGSFRYLIYERLGFSPAAYVPMQIAGGLNLSNDLEAPKGVADPHDAASANTRWRNSNLIERARFSVAEEIALPIACAVVAAIHDQKSVLTTLALTDPEAPGLLEACGLTLLHELWRDRAVS